MSDAPGWVTLTDGEEIIWQGRPTLYHFMGRTVLGLILVGFGILVWLVVDNVIETGVTVPAAVPGVILGGVIALLGLTMSAKRLLEWWNVRYLVTSKEVYKKSGVVSRSVTNLNLNQIQNTTFTQSVTGRLLSHGDVHIETAGSRGTEVTFRNVGEPETVVGHITRELDKLYDS